MAIFSFRAGAIYLSLAGCLSPRQIFAPDSRRCSYSRPALVVVMNICRASSRRTNRRTLAEESVIPGQRRRASGGLRTDASLSRCDLRRSGSPGEYALGTALARVSVYVQSALIGVLLRRDCTADRSATGGLHGRRPSGLRVCTSGSSATLTRTFIPWPTAPYSPCWLRRS